MEWQVWVLYKGKYRKSFVVRWNPDRVIGPGEMGLRGHEFQKHGGSVILRVNEANRLSI